MERVLANVIFTHSSLSERTGSSASRRTGAAETGTRAAQSLHSPCRTSRSEPQARLETCSGSVRNKIRLLYTFASSVPAKVCCMFSSRWCLHIPAVSEILLRRAVRKNSPGPDLGQRRMSASGGDLLSSQVKYPHPFPPPPSAPWVCVRTQLTKNPQSDWQQNTHTHTHTMRPPSQTHTSHHNSSRFITGCYRTATRKHTFDIFHILHIPWHLPTYYERLHRLA